LFRDSPAAECIGMELARVEKSFTDNILQAAPNARETDKIN